MSAASLTVATEEFRRAAELCIVHSERTYPQFLNGQGLRLSSFAVKHTQKADTGTIAAQLGQVSTRIRNKKTGGMLSRRSDGRRGFGVREFSSAASRDLYRIINWRRTRTGKNAIGGKEMSKPARRMRSATLRSPGFIAAGWIYAVKGLAKAVGYSEFLDTKVPKMSGEPKGWVNPARAAINSIVTCTMGNTSLLGRSAERTGLRNGNPMPVAQKGLTLAYQLTAKDMLDHLAKKLQPVFNQFSAK